MGVVSFVRALSSGVSSVIGGSVVSIVQVCVSGVGSAFPGAGAGPIYQQKITVDNRP